MSPITSFNEFPLPGGGPEEIESPARDEVEAAGPHAVTALVVEGGPPGRFEAFVEEAPEQRTVAVVSGDGTTVRVSQFELVDGGWTLAESEYCDT